MNSELIVITFDDMDEAMKVLEAMESMRKEPVLSLQQSVVVTRDRTGKTKLQQIREVTAHGTAKEDEILNLLAGLIFGAPLGTVWGIDVPQTIDEMVQRGFDQKCVAAINNSIDNDVSAILFLIPRASRSDPQEILNTLSLFKGKIFRTTISPDIAAYLAQLSARSL